MSRTCGQCHEVIFRQYRLLYRLERDEGKVGYPQKGRRLPSCTICNGCLERIAEADQHRGDTFKALYEANPGSIYILAEPDLSDFYYIRAALVSGLFPDGLRLLDQMTWDLAHARKAG